MHASYVNWPNGYVYVEFDTVLPIAGTFYVGWMQSSDFVLNVGLDRNFDEISQGQANPHIYYNVDGSWKQNTEIHGAPMIRPVMGSQSFAGIEGQKEITNGDIHLFPNPSNGKFRLSLPDNMKCEAGLYSLNGEELFAPQKLSASSDLDYSSLSQGIYLLKVSSASNVWWKKVIIQ